MHAKASCITKRARGFSLILAIDGMAGIFDNFEIVLFLDAHDFIHLAGNARPMHWKDGFRFGGNCLFNKSRIYVVISIYISKDWLAASSDDSTNCCKECIRRGNDFIALLDARSFQAEKNRISSPTNSDAICSSC